MNWIVIDTPNQIAQITEHSHQVPCLIFKHSTRCSISSIAKFRMEADWLIAENELEPYYLDIISNRGISNAIADEFGVHHESPQALLIWKGECIYNASHLDIRTDALQKVLDHSVAA